MVGEATEIRRVAALGVPEQDTSAIDELVKRLSAKPDRDSDGGRARRPKGTKP